MKMATIKALICLVILLIGGTLIMGCGGGAKETPGQPSTPSTQPSSSATLSSTPSEQPSPSSALSEQPDMATYQKYFSNMGLGKIPSGGKLPQDLQQNVTVFTAGDQISLYFSVTQEVQVRTTIYDIEAKKVVKEGGFPMSLTPSNYAGAEPLTVPAGKYEFKVYANDVLVAVLPFEVR